MLHIFLLLPDSEDTIPCSITGQDGFDSFVEDVVFSLKRIRMEDNFKLYYDSENIKKFLELYEVFVSNEKYLANATYKIRNFVGIDGVNIHEKYMREADCRYFIWTLDNSPELDSNPPQTIAEMAERFLCCHNNTDLYLLLNLGEGVKGNKQQLSIFKDAVHREDLPDRFLHFPFVTNKDETEIWLRTNTIQDFSLLSRSRFSKTKYVEQGKAVYRENATGRYWYLDNFHKNEYEVFDPEGKHIGVADMQGRVDPEQKDKARRIQL